MKEKMLTGVLLNVYGSESGEKKVVTIKDDLHTLYEVLGVDLIDCVERKIGFSRSRYTIVCDDEGLLKAPCKISAVDNYNRVALVGNLFICKTDEDGDFASLSKGECDYVMKHIFPVMTRQYPKGYLMLNDVECVG